MTFRRKLLTATDLEQMADIRKYQRIRVKSVGDLPVCDFCGTGQPLWVYAAKRTTTGAEVECWRWAACVDCAAEITARDWEHMKERIFQIMKHAPLMFSMPDYVIRTAVNASFLTFFRDVIED